MSTTPDGAPFALPLVFTHSKHAYTNKYTCVLDNDSFTEILNEDFDSYVMTPWSWNKDDNVSDKLYLLPVAFAAVVMNILVIITFVREKMTSALDVILIGISVSDTLTVLIPCAATMFMYFDGIFPDYVSYENCKMWGYLTKYFPTITHNASIWLTLVLAYDRCVAIRHPFLIRRLCLPRTSVFAIVIVYIFATLGHLCRFLDTEYVPVKIIPSTYFDNLTVWIHNVSEEMANATINTIASDGYELDEFCNYVEGIETCKAVYTPVFGNFKYYEFCYYWFVILFVKFIPCTFMIILDTLMLKALRHAEHIRQVISTKNTHHIQASQSRVRYYESRRMTIIVVIAIVIVIVVEIPVGVILIFWTLAEIHDKEFISERNLNYVARIANMIVSISYPIIFLLYCCISAHFRASFSRLCCCLRNRCSRFLSANEEPSDL
ncbi:sex peptide receptor-like [Ruditapes philippinarum]|uniref:sex peptide receptor-like n=1 Tax=Ruditapes philippinarum TaxID=129788 RepID=UPI00295B8094|nr:sex peptide receptor-like [Ruditapes philippinarum]